MNKRALIIVDPLNGFCTGGNLAVPEGEKVIPVINELRENVDYDITVVAQDFHPANHASFCSTWVLNELSEEIKVALVSDDPEQLTEVGRKYQDLYEKSLFSLKTVNGLEQVLWPDHCVQGTKDACIHPDLNTGGVVVFQKGIDPLVDSYSAFYDNTKKNDTGLDNYLKVSEITHVDVVGLAIPYCVSFTAIDAKELGYDVAVIKDACRGIYTDTTEEEALDDLKDRGIAVVTSEQAAESESRV